MFSRPDPCRAPSVERLEIGPDQHVLIRSGCVGPPDDLSRIGIQAGQPAAHPELASAVANQHLPFATIGAMVMLLALVDVAQFRSPDLFPRVGVHGDCLDVERVVVDLAVE